MISDSPSLNDTFELAAKVATLADRFSLTKFRDFQKKAIDAVLAGRDAIVVQPTGSGKSLCYQFPPIYDNIKAIVVSATISLVNDQVTNLAEKGIKSVFLGSAQLDKSAEDRALAADGAESIIFVTPEWLAKREKWEKVKALERQNKLSVIAIDEAHLYHQWKEFHNAYKDLENLKSEFSATPIIALTATAPPKVMESIQRLVRDPHIEKASVNRQNVYLQCEQLPDKDDDFSYFAARVSEMIQNNCTILYTDFIKTVGPIMSALSGCGIDSVGYTGEMDIKSRHESYQRWRKRDVNVMVAFGMGIDKSDIQHIVRRGVPESMCSWAQELGRAGRGGQLAKATIFYSMSDIDHAGAWIRGHLHNFTHCSRVLDGFSDSWQYTMSHLAGKFRRQMLLQLFGEDTFEVDRSDTGCCDLCDRYREDVVDFSRELEV